MRSILVHADSHAASANRVDFALSLARLTGGHVTAQINAPVAGLIAFDPFGGAYPMAEAIAAARADAAALAETLGERLGRDDVPFTVETTETDPVVALSNASRLADLVVMDLDDTSRASRPETSRVGSVAVQGSAPVLALQPGKMLRVDGTALVAWNDSRESAAALKAAILLLKLARAVHVLRIGREGMDFDATPALTYLSRHDIHAELHVADPAWLTVEEAIEREAQATRADYIVMGAYSRSRFSELVFGGVTRYLLESASVPLFLAH